MSRVRQSLMTGVGAFALGGLLLAGAVGAQASSSTPPPPPPGEVAPPVEIVLPPVAKWQFIELKTAYENVKCFATADQYLVSQPTCVVLEPTTTPTPAPAPPPPPAQR